MKYYCQTCNQQFDSLPKFREHNKVHPHICKYCGEEFESGTKLGGHINFCKQNPNYEQNLKRKKQKTKQIKTGSHLTQQTKQLMSKRRKQFLLSHSQDYYWKMKDKLISKPCEYLKQFLTQNNINFYPQYYNPQEFNNRYYKLDIAFPNQKIAIEVNGTQHYNKDGTLGDYYQQRHNILQTAGWNIIQLPFRRVYNQEVKQSLLQLIKQNVNFTYDYSQQIKQFLRQKQLQHICPICGGEKKDKYAKCCNKCERQKRKQNIPSKQQLQKDYEQLHNYSAIGRKYNKTNTAIRNWFKTYNIM